MSKKFNVILLASTALAGSLLLASAAAAQSTAGAVSEVVVTGRRTAINTAGLATQVNEAKDESIVSQEFIKTQVPGANFAQLINLLPGVSYSTEDPYGFNSGDLRIHGFDGNHVAVVLDGAPLNDTGNYAVYPGEYLIGELIDHITVNIGSSDVDSPSAAALGATINITSKKPPTTPGVRAELSGGNNDYGRGYAEIDSGAIGPWGTTAFVAAEYGRVHNFEGRPGDSQRYDFSGRVYQPLRGTDFLSISGIYSAERQYPAFRNTLASLATNGRFYFGDNPTWVPETARPGVVDNLSAPNPQATAGPSGSDANYFRLFPNPVNFASIRGQSKFTLLPNLTFTFDPNFFYTLANGGGSSSLSEKDKRLIGNSTAAGVDLNGDGDILDTVVAYQPSNTETYRYGLTTSLLWNINDSNLFQVGYTLDHGHHRQTGEATTVDLLTGMPDSVFGAKPGYGVPIKTADGSTIRSRDRLSIAELNQVALNYIGKFLDDKVHVNLGVRLPYFTRDINQFCYGYNGTSAYCDTISPTLVQNAYNTDVAARRTVGASSAALTALLGASVTTGVGGTPNFKFPFKRSFDFNEPLPNVGVTFRPLDHHLFYASYAKGFAAPKTDDLYLSSQDLVNPETSDNYAVGYRYQTRAFTASVNYYDDKYQNRIVQSVDPNDPTLSIDRNVGDAEIKGWDLEAGVNLFEHLHLYGSANFNDSDLKSNYVLTTSGTTFQLPTKGKELVLTPDETYSGRVSYDWGPMTFGFQGKYISSRFIDDINSTKIPAYAIFNVDARFNLPYWGGRSYLQLNIQNLFNREYISRSTTAGNYTNYPIPGTALTYTASTASYYVGAPTTMQITLNAQF